MKTAPKYGKRMLSILLSVIMIFSACSVMFAYAEDHVHDYTKSTTILPTCTARGYTVYVCDCGDVKYDDFVEPLNHDYDDGVHVDATCEVNGGTLYTCQREGCTDDEYLHTDFVPNMDEPALGHEMGEWYIAANPNEAGAYAYKRDCSREGCRHFEYETDEDGTVNTYYKVSYYTDYALPDDGYITAEDGTKLADESKYYTKHLRDDYIISGGSVTRDESPWKEAYRYATKDYGAYRVTGWTVSLDDITSNLEAHAVYEPLDVYHTVNFMHPGNVQTVIYSTYKVLHGRGAKAPEDPVKASDKTYNFEFKGWDKDFSKVYSDMTVTAVFESVKRVYKLNYHDKDGNIVASELFNNGDPALAFPTDLTPAYNDGTYSYILTGDWELSNKAPFSIKTLTVPSYCENEYDASLEDDESVPNILKGIIDIYPVYEKTAERYPVVINVSTNKGDVPNGALVRILNKSKLVAATGNINGSNTIAFDLMAGEYTVEVTYDGETKSSALTLGDDGAQLSFTFEIKQYEETPKECGCICHVPFIGRVYVFFQKIIYKLTGKKSVCCDDMNSSPYASSRGYTV